MRFAAVLLPIALMACDLPPVSADVAADRCEERARAAQGPTGSLSVGVNSENGGSGRLEVGVSSDFLRGLDPLQVYERCVFELTGELPIRPPVLRDL